MKAGVYAAVQPAGSGLKKEAGWLDLKKKKGERRGKRGNQTSVSLYTLQGPLTVEECDIVPEGGEGRAVFSALVGQRGKKSSEEEGGKWGGRAALSTRSHHFQKNSMEGCTRFVKKGGGPLLCWG